MKNKLYLLLLLLVIPFYASAAGTGAHCDVIKGTGNDIGDEINCAGEHFYIIDKANNKTKMLAKYNLLNGVVRVDVEVSEERYNQLVDMYDDGNGVPMKKAIMNEPEFSIYNEVMSITKNPHVSKGADGYYFIIYGEIPSKSVSDEKSLVHQSELAIGAHGNELGKPDPVQIGIFTTIGPNLRDKTDIYDGYYVDSDETIQTDLQLYMYDDYLKDRNINIDNIDLISLKEIKNIVYKVSGSALPLKDWFENQQALINGNREYQDVFVLGNLKEYLPAGYEWLYSTSYYTKTGVPSVSKNWFQDNRGPDLEDYIYFVDTLGFICSKYGCDSAVGAGARPVVTIDDSLLRYGIYTKVSGSGSIEVVSSAIPGELINFTIKANKDLELKRLAIVTPSGERIEFTENDITYNEDGTITIRSNTFIMPKESVTIEAEWSDYVKGVEENPKTGLNQLYIGIFVLFAVTVISYLLIRRKDYFKEM
jgi:hypothetical protein